MIFMIAETYIITKEKYKKYEVAIIPSILDENECEIYYLFVVK